MKNKTKTPNLKAIMISFCALALLSSGFFYYSSGMGNETDSKSKVTKSDLTENEREKQDILQELNELKKAYDDIIIENKNISLELIQERDKVVKLLDDLSTSKSNELELDNFKKQTSSLRLKLNNLAVENMTLKKENKEIIQQRDSTKLVLKVSQKDNEGLKRDLVNTVEKFSKLEVSNTTIITYKLKTSGELIVTDKANKVQGINISFVIAKNEIAKRINKTYYIQVMNNENLVLGDDDMRTHQYKSLTYSMASNVEYENKLVRVSENLMGKNFAKGVYYVNIFDGEELVGESSFTLK